MTTEGKGVLDFVIGIQDRRVPGRTDQGLVDIFVLALCALVAGAEGQGDIEDWDTENEAMLSGYLRLRNGIPGNDTMRRVFEVLEFKEVEMHFADWVSSICPTLERRVIAIDGNSARGSRSLTRGVKALHLVTANAVETGVMLVQQRCEEKSDEIAMIEPLLPCLALKGADRDHLRDGLSNGDCPDDPQPEWGLSSVSHSHTACCFPDTDRCSSLP